MELLSLFAACAGERAVQASIVYFAAAASAALKDEVLYWIPISEPSQSQTTWSAIVLVVRDLTQI